jgi:hypothetical protein
MEEAGFVNVQSITKPWWLGGGPNVPDFGPTYKDDSIDTIMGFYRALLPIGISAGGVEGCRTIEELNRTLEQARTDMAEDAIYYTLVVAVGQRPLK